MAPEVVQWLGWGAAIVISVVALIIVWNSENENEVLREKNASLRAELAELEVRATAAEAAANIHRRVATEIYNEFIAPMKKTSALPPRLPDE